MTERNELIDNDFKIICQMKKLTGGLNCILILNTDKQISEFRDIRIETI